MKQLAQQAYETQGIVAREYKVWIRAAERLDNE